MPPTIAEQIRTALASSRWEAERIVEFGERRARDLEGNADPQAVARAWAGLVQVRELRDLIEHHSREIDAAYARMAEALAATSLRLVQISREADFANPAWPGGLGRTVELKLSETREVTVRFTTPGDHASAPGPI